LENGRLVTRRDVVRGGGAALTLATATSSIGQAFAMNDDRSATGIVFEDRSGTGRRTQGDPGIAGVLVSNGREVVKTDHDGRYVLPVDEETIIFVIKPTGYAVPVERGVMLPRFYYIHQPDGTPPRLRFRGIDPTGPLPGSVDFALTKTDEPGRFDVLLFTDPHAESPAAIDFIRTDVVNALIGSGAAFGITAGDIMFDNLALYDRYNRVIGEIGIPWHNIAGNHDLNFDAPDRTYALETFKRTFAPTYYAFEYGGALFLREAIGLRRAGTARDARRPPGRRRHAYSAALRPRSAGPREQYVGLRRTPRPSGRPPLRQPVGPHAHDRASLSRPQWLGAASSSRHDDGLGLLVERSL
jgi:hypothetical protein